MTGPIVGENPDKENQTPLICDICGGNHSCQSCDVIQIVNHVPDRHVPSKARLTLPEFLELHQSPDGSYSVSTKEFIIKGTRFGPYLANKVTEEQASHHFPLKTLNENGNQQCYLDTGNENECSWLYFVELAEYTNEQNLVCYQEKGNVYYVTNKDVEVGDTLRVWYAPYYAARMNRPVLTPRPGDDMLNKIDINVLVKQQQNIIERNIWTCKFCSQTESDITLFAQHMLRHYANQMRKTCEFCHVQFSTRKKLFDHIKIIHNKPIISNNTTMTQERPRKIPDISSCSSVGGPLLNDLFSDSSDLPFDVNIDNHNLLLDTENLSVESLLSENVKELDHFNFEIDDNQKQFVCDICLKQFNRIRWLIIHMKHHTGQFTCRKCLKVFCRNENLKAHKCNLSVAHKCDKCFKTFTQKKYLMRHVQSIHEKKFKCLHCNKAYYSNQELQEHNCSKRPISEKKNHMCPLCDKVFMRDIYLRRHMRTHVPKSEDAGSVMCELCGKVYANRSSYRMHRESHDSDFKFRCDICDKRFYRQDLLNDHILRHLADTQIDCNECPKKFKNHRKLRSHMKTDHNTERIFRCDICSKTFRLQGYLGKHIKKHHTTKWHPPSSDDTLSIYNCPFCNKSVKLRGSIMRHIKKNHPEATKNDYSKIKPILATTTKPLVLPHIEPAKKELDINDILNDKNIKKEAVNNLVEELDLNIKNRLKSIEVSTKCASNDNEGKEDEDKTSREVCLSIPDLSENDQEITLDKNAYILENGTIVQPQGDSDNVIIYVLDQTFT